MDPLSPPRLVVIESRLAGDAQAVQRHFRFVLWCCRAVRLDGAHPLASHTGGPWYLDDAEPAEREAGFDCAWHWLPNVEHWFFEDLGWSGGMNAAKSRVIATGTPWRTLRLAEYAPSAWAAFERGEWPPHTAGFDIAVLPHAA